MELWFWLILITLICIIIAWKVFRKNVWKATFVGAALMLAVRTIIWIANGFQ